MNQDLHQAEKLTLSEKRLMQRHSRSAMAILAMHTLLCVVYFQLGYMHIALPQALVLVSLVWFFLLVYQVLMTTGVTLQWREPSLSLPLILYFIGVFVVSGYYVDEFRLSVVTLFFAALLMVSFRLSGKVMVAVAFFGQWGLCADAVGSVDGPLGAAELVSGAAAVAGVRHDFGEFCGYRWEREPPA